MKIFYYLTVIVMTISCMTFTACGNDDEDEPTNTEQAGSTSAYCFLDCQHFPKEWMVKSIQYRNGTKEIKYDNNNRPIQYGRISYEYDGNICTFFRDGTSSDLFKGYFDGNKLIKAEWDSYTITNVVYNGNKLVKGSNGYRLTWNNNGDITNYSDCGSCFTYTDIPNKANVDFNILLTLLSDSWCDDGSEYFTIFGWTGVRTKHLIKSSKDDEDYQEDYEYTIDNKGRPVVINVIRDGNIRSTYNITYLKD